MTVPRFTNPSGRPVAPGVTHRPTTTQDMSIPAPLGVNAVSPAAGMSPQDCIYTYNLMPSAYGLRTRLGYIEWSNAFTGSSIRTILPFVGDRADQFNDRLFAANDQGIYDISTQGVDGVEPTRVYDWPSVGTVSGYVIKTHFTNDAGEHFLMCADEFNGMTEYDEALDTWSASTGITGVDPTKVFFVTAHQNRLWMIEEDSSDAWYLPTGAKAGAAVKFNFGSQFREGGSLVGLYSWTVDGGDGVDDYLVAISREGGIVVYRGSDPANASTWALVGTWYIGRVPAGKRIASQYGGQLFILCANGIVSLNQLLRGASVDEAAAAVTGKVTRLIRNAIKADGELRGWELRILSDEDMYIVNTPLRSTSNHLSFCRSLVTDGWGMWRGLPMQTSDVYQNELYFADTENRVWKYTGETDGQLLNDTPGNSIPFSILTSFQGDGVWKRAQFCRPHFIASSPPVFSVQARFDFDLNEAPTTFGVPTYANLPLWDSAIWDTAVWGGSVGGIESLQGLMGWGHYIAVAMRGEARIRTILASFSIQYDSGWTL